VVGSDYCHGSEAISTGNATGSVPSAQTDPSLLRQNRDEVEDEQLQSNQLTEGMPTTIAGFKDHSLCALSYTVFPNSLAQLSTLQLLARSSHKANRSDPSSCRNRQVPRRGGISPRKRAFPQNIRELDASRV